MTLDTSNNYSVQDVLGSPNFTLAKDLQITPDKSTVFKDSVLSNANITGFSFTQGIDVVYQANTNAEKASKPKDISYQIILEPIKSVSSSAMSNVAVGTTSNMAKAFTGSSPDAVSNASKLSQNPAGIDNQDLKKSTQAASKKLATTAFIEANASEMASGHSLQASHGTRTIAGGSIKIHSDTSVFTRTPHSILSTQDYHVQANNSIVESSTSKISNHGNKVVTVDGASIENVNTSVHISSGHRDVVTPQLRMIGTETIQTMGKNHISIADTNMVSNSGGSSEYTSASNHLIRSGANIDILSSPSSLSPDEVSVGGIEALGDIVESENLVEQVNNSINIVSSHLLGKNTISLTRDGTSHSASGSFAIMAGQENYTSGMQVYSVAMAGNISFYGNELAGTITFGDKQFAGFPSPLPVIPIPTLGALPAIPSLPSLPLADLNKCIPDKFKKSDTDGFFTRTSGLPSSLEELASTIEEDINNQEEGKGGSLSSSEPPTPKVFDSNTESKTNPTQVARNLSKDPKTAISSDRTPGLTVSHEANKDTVPVASDCIDTEGICTPDVYPDRFSDSAFSLLDSITPNSIIELQNVEDLFNGRNPELLSSSATPSFLKTRLDFLPSDIFNRISPDIFTAIATQGAVPDVSSMATYKKEATNTLNKLISRSTGRPAPANLISDLNTVINHITDNPNDIGNWTAAINESLASLAIGNIPQLVSLLSKNLTELPRVIKSGSFASYLSYAQTTLSAVGVNNAQLNSLVGLGKVLSNPNSDNIGAAISETVGSQLSTLLPNVPIDSIRSIVEPLLKNPNNITKDQIETALTGALGNIPGIGAAANSLVPTLKLASQGKFSEILTGGGLTSIASLILGSKNGAQVQKISEIFSSGKDLVKSLNSIPALLKIMNSYKIPALNQIAITLNCLDLFNKIKNLISAASSLDFSSGQAMAGVNAIAEVNTPDAVNFIDNLPRYVQVINSIQSFDLPKDAVSIQQALDNPNTPPTVLGILKALTQLASPGEIAALINMAAPTLVPNGCFSIPYLTLAESTLVISSMRPKEAFFSLANPEININNIYKQPKLGDPIHITVPSYTSELGSLLPYISDYQYTTVNLRLFVSSYNPQTNAGVALYEDPTSQLILQQQDGTLVEYPIGSIGVNLFPQISDAFLVK